jgi:hypothetical protein
MAIDKSEPRVGVIAQVAIVSIVTLVATHAALVAYFDKASYEEEMRKIGTAPPTALINVRASEKERLSGGPMPIQQAMDKLAHGGRMNASPDIMPSASHDIAPLQGWTKLPGEVPAPMMAPPPAPSASAPEPSSSAAPAPSAAPSAAPAASGPTNTGHAGHAPNPNPPHGAEPKPGGSPPKNP